MKKIFLFIVFCLICGMSYAQKIEFNQNGDPFTTFCMSYHKDKQPYFIFSKSNNIILEVEHGIGYKNPLLYISKDNVLKFIDIFVVYLKSEYMNKCNSLPYWCKERYLSKLDKYDLLIDDIEIIMMGLDGKIVRYTCSIKTEFIAFDSQKLLSIKIYPKNNTNVKPIAYLTFDSPKEIDQFLTSLSLITLY